MGSQLPKDLQHFVFAFDVPCLRFFFFSLFIHWFIVFCGGKPAAIRGCRWWPPRPASATWRRRRWTAAPTRKKVSRFPCRLRLFLFSFPSLLFFSPFLSCRHSLVSRSASRSFPRVFQSWKGRPTPKRSREKKNDAGKWRKLNLSKP